MKNLKKNENFNFEKFNKNLKFNTNLKFLNFNKYF